MSDFARKQLEKYGWSEGKGLGKEESGIVNPIKSKLKFDKQGIGHDNVKQWTSAWWCDMFNDAAKRINVKNSEVGVSLSSEERVVNSNILSPVLIHKNFVKGETMTDSAVLSGNSNEQSEEKTSVISDSIFKMCEGTKKSCVDSDLSYMPDTQPDQNEEHRHLNIYHWCTTSTPRGTVSTSNQPQAQVLNDTISKKCLRKKKRVRDESTWKRNVLKKKRASGVEYVSESGKIIPARVTRENCKCKLGCFIKVPQNIQDDIITNFNEAADKDMQDMYLSSLIRIRNIQRRRPKTGEGTNRAYTCDYKIQLEDFETNVCKKAFCSFHGIGKARVERIAKCLHEKSFLKDNRGKHDNRPTKIPQHIIDTIDEHIKSFPSQKSHYSRLKSNNVCYLSPDLNVKKMHSLYLQKYEPDVHAQLEKGEKCHPAVSYDFYRRHFTTKYKLSFGKVKNS